PLLSEKIPLSTDVSPSPMENGEHRTGDRHPYPREWNRVAGRRPVDGFGHCLPLFVPLPPIHNWTGNQNRLQIPWKRISLSLLPFPAEPSLPKDPASETLPTILD